MDLRCLPPFRIPLPHRKAIEINVNRSEAEEMIAWLIERGYRSRPLIYRGYVIFEFISENHMIEFVLTFG